MRAHKISVFAAASLATLTVVSSLPMHAQRQNNAGNACPGAAIPAGIQSRFDTFQAELKRARAAGDAKAEAKTLSQMGQWYFRTSSYEKALQAYTEALTAARSAHDTSEEAAALIGLGNCYRVQEQREKALEDFQQALDLAIASEDQRGQADALNGIGWIDHNLSRNQEAMERFNRALALAQMVGDRDLEAASVLRLGAVNDSLGENDKALELYNRALSLFRAVGDSFSEAKTRSNIGIVYAELGEHRKALEYYRQGLTLACAAGDRAGVANSLVNIGILYKNLGEKQKAQDYYREALPVERALGNRAGEASTLQNIGTAYDDLGERSEALQYENQSLEIWRAIGDGDGEAGALNNIADVYKELGNSEKALEDLGMALPLWRAAGDRRGEATTLNAMGVVFDDLGEQPEALEHYNRALQIWSAVGDRGGEAEALNNIGGIHLAAGKNQQALEYFSQALALEQAVGDRDGEGRTLNNMGQAYSALGQQQKALEYFCRSMPIRREIGDRAGESSTLNNIGSVYDVLGESQKALHYYTQALPLASAVGDPIQEAEIFHNLMLSQESQRPALAVFYGKRAVNFVQQVRGYIQGLDKELQRSFLGSKGDYYHDLADLLIGQGRLPEAQQVLDLLKQQEYSDYVRGETVNALSPLTLTPAEKKAEQDYQASTKQLVSLGEQWLGLKKIKERTPGEEQQYQQLDAALNKAGQGLNDYYARLYTLFGSNSDANKQITDVQGDTAILQHEIAAMPRTVALYTLVSRDRYSVIVITGSMVGRRVEGTIVGREYGISEKNLNLKVQAFREILRDPNQDPRPLAQELYTILISPVKDDLDQAHAETLVFSLDGVLRYIPMAALFDGRQYLAENYNIAAFTPASMPHLADMPDLDNMSAVAMGISRKYEDMIPLPTVAGELKHVVNDPQINDARGVLPGSILLDGQFTEKALENALEREHTVVHIASHFVLEPGNDNQSYLLLAGKENEDTGYHLTVAEFRNEKRLNLEGTDLLTLSACETGVSSNAGNGREVDGLATTAQLKGARAVISTLWPVNDNSTGELMADFYRRWAGGNGKVTKAEALRLAQLDLLSGKIHPRLNLADSGAATSFAHPYYWAPFILMGNWR